MTSNLMRKLIGALVCLGVSLAPALALAQAEGILEIKCNIDGAIVYMDGELLGEAPITEIVPSGTHVVRVERPAYATHEETIDLPPDAAVEVIATLQRVLPGLEIRVDVESALVFLDGEKLGKGSVTIDPTTPGRHTLVVDGGDFGSYEGTIDVPPAALTPVQVKLRGSLGSVAVHSDPEGARVHLDGKDYGLTPTTIDPVKPGSYGVRISKDGHSDVLQAVVVEPGRSVSLDAVLVVEGGTLDIRTNPSNATVWVNGVEIGQGRQTLSPLKPGMYSVRVTAVGHTDFIQPVQVDAESRAVVTARLQSFDYGGGPGPGVAGKPVHQRPGFWAGIGGGAAAIVAGVVIAAAVTSQSGNNDPRVVPGTEPPNTTYTWSLP